MALLLDGPRGVPDTVTVCAAPPRMKCTLGCFDLPSFVTLGDLAPAPCRKRKYVPVVLVHLTCSVPVAL
jgi:hypothetical protein